MITKRRKDGKERVKRNGKNGWKGKNGKDGKERKEWKGMEWKGWNGRCDVNKPALATVDNFQWILDSFNWSCWQR